VGVCRNADTVVVTLEEPYSLTLETPPIGCGSLTYTPQPYDPQVHYAVNQVWTDTFPILLPASDSAYMLEASFENSCGAWQASAQTHVLLPEEVAISAPEGTVFCLGSPPVPLHASHSFGTWSGPHLISEGADAWFHPVASGSFEITFTRGTDTCRRADTILLIVIPTDSVEAGPDLHICQSAGPTLLSGGFPAGGFFSGTAVLDDTVSLQNLMADSAYAFLYTIPTFPPGCRSDTFTLTAAAPPDAAFQLDRDTLCQADTVTLFPVSAGTVGFSVDWGDGTSAGSQLFHAYAQPGTYPVVLTVQNFHPLDGTPLCTVSDSADIFLPEPLAPGQLDFLADPSDGCAPLTVTLTNMSQPVHEHYLWEFGNGQTHSGYSAPSQWYSGTPSAYVSYEIRLRVPGGCGVAEVVRNVGVLPPPIAGIGLTDETPCSGTPVEANILSIGTPASNTFFTSTGGVVPGSPPTPTTFVFETGSLIDTVSIWLVSTNECGTDTALATVYVQPSDVTAEIGFPADLPPCTQTDFPLFNQSTPGAPVLWKVSNGLSSIADTIQLETAAPGSYTVSLYAFGCGFDSTSLVLDFQPLPMVSLDHPLFGCTGQPVPFDVVHDGSALHLSFGDGNTADMAPTEHSYTSPGQYQVSAETTASSGCRSTAAGSIEILPTPQAQLNVPDTLCPGQAASFSASSDQPMAACSWQFGNSGFASGCQLTHVFPLSGPHTVLLSVTSPEGCTGRDTVQVTALPRATAVTDHTVLDPCTPLTVSLRSLSAGAASLTWYLGDGTTTLDTALTHTYQDTGTYTVLLVTDEHGPCPDSATLSLEALPSPTFDWVTYPPCLPEEGNGLLVRTRADHLVTLRGDGYQQAGAYHWNLTPGPYVLQVTNAAGCSRDTLIVLPDIPPMEVLAEPDTFDLLLGTAVTLLATSNQAGTRFQWEPATYLDASDRPDPLTTPLRSITYLVVGTDTLGCQSSDTVTVIVRADRRTGIFIPDAFTPNDDGVNDLFYVRSSNPSVQYLERCQVFDQYGEIVFETGTDGLPAQVEDERFGWDGTFRGQKAEAGTYRYLVVLRYIDGASARFTGSLQLLR
jgi:gliding motility-associated-like protein